MLSVVARELRVMVPAMVTRPSRWPGKLFRGERGKFIHRDVLFLRKLGKNQTNCPYTTVFSEIVKIPSEGERGNRERDTWDVFVGSAPQVELQLGKLPGGFFFTRNSRIPIGPRRADFEIQCKKTC